MTKISVIIPVYNAENYLSKCLNSVVNQTFKDIEIICINDCSTDNSLEILKKIATTDRRIKIIDNIQNIGAALSRNIGIDCANGEYIYFIDADDSIDEAYLETMFSTIENEKCNIVLNLSIMADNLPYKHPSMPEINKNGEFLDNISIIHNAPCFIWARIYRKSFLDKYNLIFIDTHADDVVFNTITNMYCDKTFVFYGKKYHYTVNNIGMTGQANRLNNKDLNHIKAHSLIYDYLKEHKKLDNRLKLFRVYPFIKVDTEEKFEFYKKFFIKIQAEFYKNENIYNNIEKYFAHSILNSTNYENYLKNYNKVVTIGFLRDGVQKV